MVQTTGERPRRRNALPAVVAALSVLAALVVVCQLYRPARAVGHDTWELLPVRDWGLAVGSRAGFWDGMDNRTHQGIGGRIYVYVFIERTTNTQ